MSLTLYGMGTGAIAGIAGVTNDNAAGYILGSSGLDLYKYKLDKEINALNDPAAYLTAKKNAMDALINKGTIQDNIENETFKIGRKLGFPGYRAGAAPARAFIYSRYAPPFVRNLAANRVLENLKQGLAMIDIQFPNLIDEIAKKKQKKRIKSKVEVGDQL